MDNRTQPLAVKAVKMLGEKLTMLFCSVEPCSTAFGEKRVDQGRHLPEAKGVSTKVDTYQK
ncbi:hypothetical protein, partial [Stenotrophomonas maltophilia]|uniref:hypothetical protein n=1 Tax=Stenotrophomonas maltophilia TaxID=40324 RepID=UPI0019549EB6